MRERERASEQVRNTDSASKKKHTHILFAFNAFVFASFELIDDGYIALNPFDLIYNRNRTRNKQPKLNETWINSTE